MRRAQWMVVVMLSALSALSACKGASGESTTKKESKEESKEEGEGNGSIDVKYEKEKTTFKVGTAYAMPQPFGDDGVLYTFFVYNDGVKDPPCSDELFPSDPVGGNDWAVSIEMSPIGDPVPKTVKNKKYEKAMVRFYFVASKGEYKGSTFNGVTDIDNDNATLTIVSIDGKTITAKIDAEQKDKGSRMKGTFKAKICKPKKKDD